MILSNMYMKKVKKMIYQINKMILLSLLLTGFLSLKSFDFDAKISELQSLLNYKKYSDEKTDLFKNLLLSYFEQIELSGDTSREAIEYVLLHFHRREDAIYIDSIIQLEAFENTRKAFLQDIISQIEDELDLSVDEIFTMIAEYIRQNLDYRPYTMEEKTQLSGTIAYFIEVLAAFDWTRRFTAWSFFPKKEQKIEEKELQRAQEQQL